MDRRERSIYGMISGLRPCFIASSTAYLKSASITSEASRAQLLLLFFFYAHKGGSMLGSKQLQPLVAQNVGTFFGRESSMGWSLVCAPRFIVLSTAYLKSASITSEASRLQLLLLFFFHANRGVPSWGSKQLQSVLVQNIVHLLGQGDIFKFYILQVLLTQLSYLAPL